MLCKLIFLHMKVIFLLFWFASVIFAQDSLITYSYPHNDSLKFFNSDSSFFSDKQSAQYERSINSREWTNPNSMRGIFYDRIDNNSIVNPNKNYRNSFIDSPTFKVVLGTAILFGVSAAYFKLEADKYDQKYLDTGENNFRLKRNDYDIYSGISLVLLQVNFGYLIYRFLDE